MVEWLCFFFSSRRRHTRSLCDWSSDVCSSDLTYQFLERVREHYGIPVEVFFPQPEAVEKLVREKGLFSFYKDGHKECCGIRKVEPLVRALRPLKAWVTGQRRDQSPGTRAEVAVVQLDPTFGSPERPLVKFNPLANWTPKPVWAYLPEP